jgi:putative transcriptional regulator
MKGKTTLMKNNIAILRKNNNMTQLELAELVAVSRQTIISVESGKFNPSLRLAYDIAKIFEKQIEEIFDFTAKEDEF